MIVKFARRGKGSGSGPVEYLLGKERDREGATLNRGNPDQVQALIDSSPYAKKYTTGYLSFAEQNLPTETKERLMSEFQEALLPGLEPDQYSILWVEHVDKGRLELNFVVPNIELQTGKRLQPYFHKADNPRIDAWRTAKNIELGLHDPDDPVNRQELVQASDLPPESKKVGDLITDGLLQMANSGRIKSRKGVIAALESKGFDIARVTKKSISIKHPEEGRKNIRLKGLLYEQDFRYGEGLQRAIEEASERHRATAQARLQEARSTYSSCFERKRAENNKRYKRPERPFEPSNAKDMDLVARHGDHRPDSVLGRNLVAGSDHRPEPTRNQPSAIDSERARSQGRKNSDEYVWRPKSTLHQDRSGSEQLRSGRGLPVEDTRGILENDRVRNPIIERIRAIADAARNTTKGIREAIQRFSGAIQQESTGQHPLAEKCLELDRASANLSAAAPAVGKALQQEQAIEAQRNRPSWGLSR
ncbi:mobilization relaxase [Vibrio lentus]|nr:relaxase/mobilization nuclease domain-containing protein [Vibrio lentus]PMM23381.1 mobilization relaxase [Vibrio lentus]